MTREKAAEIIFTTQRLLGRPENIDIQNEADRVLFLFEMFKDDQRAAKEVVIKYLCMVFEKEAGNDSHS